MRIQSSVEVCLNSEDRQKFSVLSLKAFFSIFHIFISVCMSLMQHVSEMHFSNKWAIKKLHVALNMHNGACHREAVQGVMAVKLIRLSQR